MLVESADFAQPRQHIAHHLPVFLPLGIESMQNPVMLKALRAPSRSVSNTLTSVPCGPPSVHLSVRKDRWSKIVSRKTPLTTSPRARSARTSSPRSTTASGATTHKSTSDVSSLNPYLRLPNTVGNGTFQDLSGKTSFTAVCKSSCTLLRRYPKRECMRARNAPKRFAGLDVNEMANPALSQSGSGDDNGDA